MGILKLSGSPQIGERSISYTKVRPPVQGDNSRSLVSGIFP